MNFLTLKNKGFQCDAIKVPFEFLSVNSYYKNSFKYFFKHILITFFHSKEPFVQWEDFMDVKGSPWNH